MNTSLPQTQKKKRQVLHNSIFSDRLNDVEQLKDISHRHIKRLGYDYICHTSYFPSTATHLNISNFPEEWRQSNHRIIGKQNNPFFVFGKNTISPFYWDEVLDNPSLNTDVANAFIENALQYDVHDGMCFPIHGAGYEWGLLSVAKVHGEHTKTNNLHSIEKLQLFAKELHEKLKDIAVRNSEKQSDKSILSPRESECLDWIAFGKTAWETAQIIGVTESTVSFHLRNIIIKLNASNRAHAVALGMARSLIHNPAKHNYG